MKTNFDHLITELREAEGFGSLEVIQRLPEKRRVLCNTLELQLEAIRGVMNLDRIDMQEEFVILLLTDDKELIAAIPMYRGTRDEVQTDRADIIQLATIARAYYVVTAHNHPNGARQPSEADLDSDIGMAHALKFCGMELLDSIIISSNGDYSMVENGLIRG